MKPILLMLILFNTTFIFSQPMKEVEKNIEVGMFIKIKNCVSPSKSFESMDLYTKTRYPAKGFQIDSASGEGIFDQFFTPGDFDAKRLPCSFENQKYRVAALKVFPLKGGEKRVMICYTENPLSLIWIEFDKAVGLKEIEW